MSDNTNAIESSGTAIATILQVLDDPYKVIGLILMLFFGVLIVLAKNNMLGQAETPPVIKSFLRYFFVLSLVGFAALIYLRPPGTENAKAWHEKITVTKADKYVSYDKDSPIYKAAVDDNGLSDHFDSLPSPCDYQIKSYQIANYPFGEKQDEINTRLVPKKLGCEEFSTLHTCSHPFVAGNIISFACHISVHGWGAASSNERYETFNFNLQTQAGYKINELYDFNKFCTQIKDWVQDPDINQLAGRPEDEIEKLSDNAALIDMYLKEEGCKLEDFEQFYLDKGYFILVAGEASFGRPMILSSLLFPIPLDVLKPARFKNSNLWPELAQAPS